MRLKRLGVTLIELLIIVASVAILAAIAAPNFRDGQFRSKLSRVRADLRVYATALEAYRADNSSYPPDISAGPNDDRFPRAGGFIHLSTPVAYMSSGILIDPFASDDDPTLSPFYFYSNLEIIPAINGPGIMQGFPYLWDCANHRWKVSSAGPDRTIRFVQCARFGTIYFEAQGSCGAEFCWEIANSLNIYDPTNGTRSAGEIGRTGFGLQ